MGDSRYITCTKVLEGQKEFVEGDLLSPGPFLDIVDEGYIDLYYYCLMGELLDGRACGGQRCLRLAAFAQIDNKFNPFTWLVLL